MDIYVNSYPLPRSRNDFTSTKRHEPRGESRKRCTKTVQRFRVDFFRALKTDFFKNFLPKKKSRNMENRFRGSISTPEIFKNPYTPFSEFCSFLYSSFLKEYIVSFIQFKVDSSYMLLSFLSII